MGNLCLKLSNFFDVPGEAVNGRAFGEVQHGARLDAGVDLVGVRNNVDMGGHALRVGDANRDN